jgi:hypothetical protein
MLASHTRTTSKPPAFSSQIGHFVTYFIQLVARLRRDGLATDNWVEQLMYWTDTLKQASAKRGEQHSDPFRRAVQHVIGCVGDCVSTSALLDLLDVPNTTGNSRRIAPIMRSLGFIPIKSRRLMPGGYRGTVTRGWARPLLPPSHVRRRTVEPSNTNTLSCTS